jgi:hypothetical protein
VRGDSAVDNAQHPGHGFSYYHLWPGNETLVWDRLPMTLVAMMVFTIIIGEFASLKIGRLLL